MQSHNAQTQATPLLLEALNTAAEASCCALLDSLQLTLHHKTKIESWFEYCKQADKKQLNICKQSLVLWQAYLTKGGFSVCKA